MIFRAYPESHGLATNRRHLSDISTYRNRPRSCFYAFWRIRGDSVYLHPLVNNTSVDIFASRMSYSTLLSLETCFNSLFMGIVSATSWINQRTSTVTSCVIGLLNCRNSHVVLETEEKLTFWCCKCIKIFAVHKFSRKIFYGVKLSRPPQLNIRPHIFSKLIILRPNLSWLDELKAGFIQLRIGKLFRNFVFILITFLR